MAKELELSTLNLQDALDVAVLIEKEAEERYQLFADMLGTVDAADFFVNMARNEGKHGAELAEKRRSLFGDKPSRITEDMIEDIEAPDQGEPRPFMSARHALEVALKSEVKAYNFFDQALEGIRNPEVRKLFKDLRKEELEHQMLVKKERLKYPDTLEPDIDPNDVETPAL